MAPYVVNFSGPYGVGKDTLVARALRELGPKGWRVRTTTTRPVPDGFDPSYLHLDEPAFRELTSTGEWIITSQIGGAYLYATSIDEIRSAGSRGQVAVHSLYAGPEGAGRFREVFGSALLSIGLLATGHGLDSEVAELTRRLEARGRDDETTIRRRLPFQHEKLSYVTENPMVSTPDGPMRAFDLLVVNDDLSEATSRVLRYLHDQGLLPEYTHHANRP